MRYVSSDTNVWIDFHVISKIKLPFLLPYRYIMYYEAIDDEVISPASLKEELLSAGLTSVDISAGEFFRAEAYGEKYPRLSIYDRIALAISKERKIPLLTGDKRLRSAAMRESVELMGTISILDELMEKGLIDESEYEYCLKALSEHNGAEVRLPENELSVRLQRFGKKNV